MTLIYVLIVFSNHSYSGIGFTHTFYNKESCEIAAKQFEEDFRGHAFCTTDLIPETK